MVASRGVVSFLNRFKAEVVWCLAVCRKIALPLVSYISNPVINQGLLEAQLSGRAMCYVVNNERIDQDD